ncbi:MAG: hypothetical protein KJS97_13575 [Alphaproteobacteria bacterium]|nr:hypothetical protein [Alphaproteobacteria bacterium]
MAPREVDPKRTRKALRMVRKLAARSAQAAATAAASVDDPATAEPASPDEAADYSEWERTFLTEVETRLETYGSAFANLAKGRPDEALSTLQAQKLREIAAKAAGKPARAGLKTRKPLRARAPMRSGGPRSAAARDDDQDQED